MLETLCRAVKADVIVPAAQQRIEEIGIEVILMSHLQIIAELETVTEMQARVIKIMATRLAELGDTVTGRDEIAQADKAYRDAIGGDEWPDWAEQGGEDDGEPYHTGGA